LDGAADDLFNANQSFPFVLGNWPAMRGSRRQAASVARANALNSASTMWCGSSP